MEDDEVQPIGAGQCSEQVLRLVILLSDTETHTLFSSGGILLNDHAWFGDQHTSSNVISQN